MAIPLDARHADDLSRRDGETDLAERRPLRIRPSGNAIGKENRRRLGLRRDHGSRSGREIRAHQRFLIPRGQGPLGFGAYDRGGKLARVHRVRCDRPLDQPPSAQHGHRIGDRQDLPDLVKNEQNGDAARLEASQPPKERLDAAWRQHRGRLVEDQEARIGDKRAGDLNALLQLDRQIANTVPEARLNAKIFEMRLPARLEPAPGEDRAPPLSAELHRLGDREGGRQGEALVNELDSRRARSIDVAGGDVKAVDLERPGNRSHDSRDHARESRLACAVLSDDGVNELWRKGDAHIGQRGEVAVTD